MSSFQPYTLHIPGRLLEIDRPQVMGIINVTPDSFFSGSRTGDAVSVETRVREMIDAGVDIIDVGGYSSRPGADDVSVAEEIDRVARGLEAIRRVSATIPVSVDTFRAAVAVKAVEQYEADIVNDISGGELDEDMFPAVASLGVPYILMHMRGTPATMQQLTDYDNLVSDIISWLAVRLQRLRAAGVADVIVDPGFGFSKTMQQNYQLLGALSIIRSELQAPVLVGLSRKSMITRALGIDPCEALEGTVCLNTIAIMQGASILRVHDVKAARHTVDLTRMYLKANMK